MAGKGGSEKGKKHNYPSKWERNDIFLKHLIADIKHNGMMYLRARSVVEQIQNAAPEIEIEYKKDDNVFIARYTK